MSSNVLQVVDANDVTQNICVASPDTPTDKSGSIAVTGTTQIVMDIVPTGFVRGAWFVQNKSQSGSTMQINELGGDADTSPTCVDLAPGAFWPPPGYPVSQEQISVTGQGGDAFAAREWLTPVQSDE